MGSSPIFDEGAQSRIKGVNMSKETEAVDHAKVSAETTAIQQFSEVRMALETVREEYSKIKIKGPEDFEGYKKAKDAAKEAGVLRRNIDARKKVLKEDALRITQAYDKTARELQAIINPIEDELKRQIDEVDDFKAKEKLKAERAADLPIRKEKLAKYQHTYTDDQLLMMGEVEFLQALSLFQQKEIDEQNEKIRKQDEENRKAQEQKQKEADLQKAREDAAHAERNRVAHEQAEAERTRKEQEEKERREKILPIRADALAVIMRTVPGMSEEQISRDIRDESENIIKMSEADFSKMLDAAKEKAAAEREQHMQNLGESQKIAMWIDAMLAIERPKLVEGSIMQNTVTEIVEYLEGAK